MYSVSVSIKGISPMLQHQFPMPEDIKEALGKGGRRASGATDYSEEWREYLYVDSDGEIYHPASHFEGAMVKAATNFKIQGKRGKTYKDLIKGYVTVTPEQIPMGIKEPKELTYDADSPLYLDVRPVVVQRARVLRTRPAFKEGWEMSFEIEVLDDQIPEVILKDILETAGRMQGIGDFRPKFGRFTITRWEAHKNGKE